MKEYPQNFNFRLSDGMAKEMKVVTEKLGITRGEFIRRAIAARLRLRMKGMGGQDGTA